MLKYIKRWAPLTILIILLALFLRFQLYHYLSFESLKLHRVSLLAWTDQHLILAILSFMLMYIIGVASSMPGAFFLTFIGGFLFGPFLGTLTVVISATLGAIFVYLAVKLAFREWVAKRNAQWLKSMEQGFKKNALSYLLFLRLVPVFPFFLVNIIPALLGVPLSTFIIGTFFGIIPGSFIYVLVGNGLGHVFDTNSTPNISILTDPALLGPLIGLALLALVPMVYRHIQQRRQLS
ncbi:MAG: TVP38/TMEM64 family protein [Legionellaceae bacterium]|nr:TVP38/TMEM64 family protein [Legionellaceae bacterium]